MLAASEENPAALARSMPLPRPSPGTASRVQLGRAELVLEHSRGSYSLLWSDGREARRYLLGLSESGQLSVELRAPKLPVHIVPRELLTIVPNARMRGFMTVPLIPTVVWRDGLNQQQTLIELHQPNLQGHWDETSGHSIRTPASWMVRFPFQTGEPHVVVPIRLYNTSSEPACPGKLELEITDDDLLELRGSIVVRPRRMHWADQRMKECTE
ncbi:MAG: hypothetical protein ACI89X_000329 [Planctomycetota bacterium]|jgi:hypothetical protein